MNILTIRRFYGFISPHLRPVVEAVGRMEANSSCLILRTLACVGYKESEEHIFKTKTGRKPFPLQNHRSLKDILASCRQEFSKRLAAVCSMFTS